LTAAEEVQFYQNLSLLCAGLTFNTQLLAKQAVFETKWQSGNPTWMQANPLEKGGAGKKELFQIDLAGDEAEI
jgi:hypothetical protein